MNFNENKPIYLQIVDYVCEQAMTGKWKEGDKILSSRELGSLLEVNPNTALRAYDYLQNVDIVENRRGLGSFMCSGALEKIIHLRKERFFNEELPLLFKSMKLLDIQLDELENAYQKFSINPLKNIE
ncbi:MAG: GntR family transcriptional regulator [Bacteroidales bacterium]|jgi:DNA-binding transcriptional regulator YhcF (GntR family)|nr:GntR family transcriptional regulator [Bacteroidales bacterium]